MEMITTNLPMLILVVGVLAFLISVITEITKNISFLKRIPTDVQVIVLSIVLCLVTYFAYAEYYKLVITWYLIVVAIIGSFIVAFVAMYGWEKLSELFKRFKK